MKRVIINGANGYVASNFINELLLQQFEVIALVRGSKKSSAEERMIAALAEVNGGTFTSTDKLRVCNYSLLDDNFGMPDELLRELFDGVIDYYHFAASLKYDFKAKDEIFQTNLDGVENSVRVYAGFASRQSRFFFISTAYSCGKISGLFEEKFYDNADISMFRNYYEQSKRFAENLIRKHIEEDSLNGHILRLSQVVGHNQSGVTTTDYGIFDFARRIQSLANRYPNRTVRVKVDPDSTQNLIPIDTVVSYLMHVVKSESLPTILNIVAKNAVSNLHILDSLCELLPIKLVPQIDIEKSEMDSYERIISIGMSFTSSYTDTNIHFDTTNLDLVANGEFNEANEQSIHRMLKYFIGNLLGQNTDVCNSAC